MLAITGWISLFLLGGGPATGEPAGQVRVHVRYLEMKGVSWRGAAFHELTPQGRQGAASVWTANQAGLKILCERADQVVQCPFAVTAEGASSQVKNETQHNYVAHLKRVTDGPPGENTAVAYEPVVGTVSDGVASEFSCRAIEGGTMVKVTVDNAHLLGFHAVTVADSVTNPKTKKQTLLTNMQVQVPELTTCHVAGEWLVPHGGVLVVGCGARSDASGKSRSSVRERLVVIEPTILNAQDAELDRVGFGGPIFLRKFEPTPLKTADAWVRAAKFNRPKPVAAQPVPPARPLALSPTMLPVLASPTLAPRVGLKATVRLDVRTIPPIATDEDVLTVMCLPLSPAPLPIGLSNVWLSASIEPRRAGVAPMRMAAPPSRVLPIPIALNGEVVDLPPLPDDLVLLASTAEATPTPQTKAAPAARAPRPIRPLDARVGEILDQFLANRQDTLNQMVCDEVVIYPAPAPPNTNPGNFIPRLQVPFSGGCYIRKDSISKSPANLQPAPPDERGGLEGDILRHHRGLDFLTSMTKNDAHAFRTHYLELMSGGDGSPNEIIGRPIRIELPSTPNKAVRGATLGLQLKTADGECEYDSGISLKSIEAQPVTVRIPMADGTIVEIQAKVVKSAKK